MFQSLNCYVKRRGKRITDSISISKQSCSLPLPFSRNQSSGDLQGPTMNKASQTISCSGLMTRPNGKLKHLSSEQQWKKPGEWHHCSYIPVTVTILHNYLYTVFHVAILFPCSWLDLFVEFHQLLVTPSHEIGQFGMFSLHFSFN